MPVYVPPGCARVIHSIRLTNDPDPMAVTYGLMPLDGDVTFTPQAITDELHDAFGDFWIQAGDSDYTLTQTETYWNLDADSDTEEVAVKAENRVSGTILDTLPQNNAFLVHKRTGKSGRRNRGRLYLPGVEETAVDDRGVLTGAFLGTYQGWLTTWLARFGAGALLEFGMCILHTYPEGGSTAGSEMDPTRVTSLVLDPVIATQRRRLRR